jgi:hypothetical protein
MKKFAMALILVQFMGVSAFSQTEVFERDLTGIHPYTGLKWNKNITQPLVGFEYTIESRTSLGMQVDMPLKDTVFSNPPAGDTYVKSSRFHSYFFNPYVQFEFLEPDNASLFSFSVRGDYVYVSPASDDSGNGFSQSSLGLGPVFALRFHAGEKLEIIPKASYEFFFTRLKMNEPTDSISSDKRGAFSDNSFIQHDISAAVNLLYRLNETQGLNFEPRIVFKLGDGRRSDDLLNIDLQIGYFLSF